MNSIKFHVFSGAEFKHENHFYDWLPLLKYVTRVLFNLFLMCEQWNLISKLLQGLLTRLKSLNVLKLLFCHGSSKMIHVLYVCETVKECSFMNQHPCSTSSLLSCRYQWAHLWWQSNNNQLTFINSTFLWPFLHFCNILVKAFTMFITHCSTVQWENIKMRVQEMDLQWHVAAKPLVCFEQIFH